MKIRNILLKFMMSGWPFKEDEVSLKNKKTGEKQIVGGIYETKTDYIGKVTGFLEDGIKQMKKDFSIK